MVSPACCLAGRPRRWLSTIGSMSTYATRASGMLMRADSCVPGDVGSPQPMSMNWPIPCPAAQLTARSRNRLFSVTVTVIGGKMSMRRCASSRSAAKLSLPPLM